jgi:23S rRNA (guanosine2251-2'-O)-methyltransferase
MLLTLYGKRVIEYLLQKHRDKIREILISKRLSPQEKRRLKGLPVKFIDNRLAQKLSRNGNHQGYLARIEFHPPSPEIGGKYLLVLDRVTDMGNLGALVRTSYALGIDLVIVTGIKELKWEALIRTSAGAGLDMPILVYQNILDLLNILKQKGYLLVGGDRGGECRVKGEKIALILGSEGEGLSGKVKKKLDKILSVEMKRDFDSLNVAVAGGILIDRIVNGC